MGGPVESRDDGLQGADEELKELDLHRRAERDHDHAATRFGDTHHLAQAARQVRKEHDPELGGDHVEAVIREIERLSIHDVRRERETFLRRA